MGGKRQPIFETTYSMLVTCDKKTTGGSVSGQSGRARCSRNGHRKENS
jgi:hypothetical protein